MSQQRVGWVCDYATTQRRIHVHAVRAGVVALTVEVYRQQACVVELDEDGTMALLTLLAEAQALAARTQEGA